MARLFEILKILAFQYNDCIMGQSNGGYGPKMAVTIKKKKKIFHKQK